MTRHEFRNALCCLRNIDAHELVSAGVIDNGDGKAWQTFASNPERFYLRCDDERQEKLWGLIEGQMQANRRPIATGIDRVILPMMNGLTPGIEYRLLVSMQRAGGDRVRAKMAGKFVFIWSAEHRAWWRPDRCGYTTHVEVAGVYSFEDAWDATNHCGPGKGIAFYVAVPAAIEAGASA